MGEAIAFRPRRTWAALGLLVTLAVLSFLALIYLPIFAIANDPSQHGRGRALVLVVIIPLTGMLAFLVLARTLRVLVFAEPFQAIKSEGLELYPWGLVLWRDVRTVEVGVMEVDSKRGTTEVVLKIEVANLNAHRRNLNWIWKACTLWRDHTKPVLFGQHQFAACLSEIAAAIEANRPKVAP